MGSALAPTPATRPFALPLLPVVPVDHITHADDHFRCESYKMKLSASMCGKRQAEATRELRAKDRWMSGRGTLELAKCRGCRTGQQVARNVAAGPTRAPRAQRRGSVVLPQRTRDTLSLAVVDIGLRGVARGVGLSPGTVRRAVDVGQIRRTSFRRLCAVLRVEEA